MPVAILKILALLVQIKMLSSAYSLFVLLRIISYHFSCLLWKMHFPNTACWLDFNTDVPKHLFNDSSTYLEIERFVRLQGREEFEELSKKFPISVIVSSILCDRFIYLVVFYFVTVIFNRSNDVLNWLCAALDNWHTCIRMCMMVSVRDCIYVGLRAHHIATFKIYLL